MLGAAAKNRKSIGAVSSDWAGARSQQGAAAARRRSIGAVVAAEGGRVAAVGRGGGRSTVSRREGTAAARRPE